MRFPRLACPTTRKTCYVDQGQAEKAVEQLWARPGKNVYGVMPNRVYLCDCGWWHMTHRIELPKEEHVRDP
jgi:hypothetical protein